MRMPWSKKNSLPEKLAKRDPKVFLIKDVTKVLHLYRLIESEDYGPKEHKYQIWIRISEYVPEVLNEDEHYKFEEAAKVTDGILVIERGREDVREVSIKEAMDLIIRTI